MDEKKTKKVKPETMKTEDLVVTQLGWVGSIGNMQGVGERPWVTTPRLGTQVH